ncbi:MAG: elongation factor P, partial [Thermoguttaceae bacterium]|nr:elongation factor P [Thermoguttaceae bacterium]
TYYFMEKETYEQYELPKEKMDDAWKYLLPEVPCKMLLYNDAPIGITPPPHVVLKVEYTEPAVRGNTATNVTKPAKLETGAEIIVPNFVETGETIKVDTRTNEYVERVKA